MAKHYKPIAQLDTVIHQDHPDFGMGIVFSVNEHNVARVAWAGLDHPWLGEHNTAFLSLCD